MAESSFRGKDVVLLVRETKIVELKGTFVSEGPEGVTVRHDYRKKGERLEFIPREEIHRIYVDEGKPATQNKAKAAKPAPKPQPVEDEEEFDTGTEEGDITDDEEFDDAPDLDEYEDDDFDDED